MKSIFLFCTKLYVFLIELPPIILLWITLSMHEKSTDVFGYYPLEIFLCLVIVFIMVYFFRAITISEDEIRMHGIFSSKDKALIKQDQTLVIGILPKGNLRIELYGNLGSDEIYSWMKAGEGKNREISLFRERAVGDEKTVKRLIKSYGITDASAEAVLTDTSMTAENDNVLVTAEEKNEVYEVHIKYKRTIV